MSQEAERHAQPPKVSCCACPYCDADFADPLPICKVCGHELRYCSECGAAIKKDEQVCPSCGAKRVTEVG